MKYRHLKKLVRARFMVAALIFIASCSLQSDDSLELASGKTTVADKDVNYFGDDFVFDAKDLSLEVIATIELPVDAAARKGDNSTYFVSQCGRIFRYEDAHMQTLPVLDISDLTKCIGEQGLLGLAFSNDGANAYINFTDLSGDTNIASMQVQSDGELVRETMHTILTIDQPFVNHNGGDLIVEPEGTLLIPTGDGGSANDPLRVALDDTSLLGKVLRIDPFDGTAKVIARGFRNPWRVDLYNDSLWIADVGQDKWEEVNVIKGISKITLPLDFGWSAFEAFDRFNVDQTSNTHIEPAFAYEHGEDGCSISGGAIAVKGALRGRYVFADYCSGRLWSISTGGTTQPNRTLHFENLDTPIAIVRANENLFVLSYSGTISQVRG